MNYNVPLSNQVQVAATIDPDAYTAAAYTSDWVSMATYNRVMAVVMAGTLGSSATLDAKLQEATDGSGTGNQDIAGKAITQLTEAGTDSDKQAIIECRADELTDGFTHVALVMTVATATSDAGALILGALARNEPATDLASVDEIVT